MGTEQAAAGKPCAICGVDCSNRERVKDAAGRYYCKTCVEKKGKAPAPPAARPAPAAPPPPASKPRSGALDPLEELARFEANAEVIEEESGACPNCRKPMPLGAILCGECGYNRRIGKQVSMASVATAPKAATRGGGAAIRMGKGTGTPEFLKKEWMFLVGPMALFLVLFAVARSSPSLLPVYVMVYQLSALAVSIWALVTAFKEGLSHFLLSFFCGLYALVFVFFINDDARLKYAYGAMLLGVVPFFVIGLDALVSFGNTALNNAGVPAGTP